MSDCYLLDKYNKTTNINEYYKDILEYKLNLRIININKVLWIKRMAIIKENNYHINCGEKDIDSIKIQNNNHFINSPKITLKTVLSSIQYYNKYKR